MSICFVGGFVFLKIVANNIINPLQFSIKVFQSSTIFSFIDYLCGD